MLTLFYADAPHIAVYRQGDTRRGGVKSLTMDSLEIGTGERQTYDLESLLDEVHALSPDWESVGKASKERQLDVFLYVVASFGATAPALVLTPQHLRWLADLGAVVDVDLSPGSYAG